MRRVGLTSIYDLEVGPREKAGPIATFKRGNERPLTPMLKARLEHSGSWRQGEELWLKPSEIRAYVAKRPIRSTHRALRENWEASAPMLFADGQLSLFGTTADMSQDFVSGLDPEC